jgi:hypothetical protein
MVSSISFCNRAFTVETRRNKILRSSLSRCDQNLEQRHCVHTRVYPKVSVLATWSENCKWYGSLPLSAVVWLFYESV